MFSNMLSFLECFGLGLLVILAVLIAIGFVGWLIINTAEQYDNTKFAKWLDWLLYGPHAPWWQKVKKVLNYMFIWIVTIGATLLLVLICYQAGCGILHPQHAKITQSH